ncbi:MAG TPA: DUF3460 family protein [Azonexus sp.]|nr:DUF3460 family protein [Azonexus sp.]
MSNFLSRLFRKEGDSLTHPIVDRAFVSEYTQFIEHYLEEHPEVLDDQHDGRLIYWDKKVDLVAQKKAEMDAVPDDIYGFHSFAWTNKEH